jgi:hypothetical protein
VQLAGGSYSNQSLSGDRGGDVTFRAAVGATVNLTGRTMIQNTHHIVFDGLNFPRSDPNWELQLDSCNDHVTIQNGTGRRFMIFEGNSNITFSNESWGGYSSYGDEDSGIGTTGAVGPTRRCSGVPAPLSRNIVFDHVTFHDVHWGQTIAQSGSHPDCFAIDGYVDGVTIRNSTFQRCANSFIMITPDQGPIYHLTIDHNAFIDLGNDSYYGVQLTDSGGLGCGDFVFSNNSYQPNDPNGNDPYGAPRTECAPAPGHVPTQVFGNTFQQGPPSNACAVWRAAPFLSNWHENTFTLGSPCP